jgi:hypothetical protein
MLSSENETGRSDEGAASSEVLGRAFRLRIELYGDGAITFRRTFLVY